jgi:mRNA-degrading endonuclease RelE of RelBE toxin-antitoxin system
VPWIPFGGINWYRLRVSKKYRILAHIKDETRSVMLIAGHKIKLVAAIGKRKDES